MLWSIIFGRLLVDDGRGVAGRFLAGAVTFDGSPSGADDGRARAAAALFAARGETSSCVIGFLLAVGSTSTGAWVTICSSGFIVAALGAGGFRWATRFFGAGFGVVAGAGIETGTTIVASFGESVLSAKGFGFRVGLGNGGRSAADDDSPPTLCGLLKGNSRFGGIQSSCMKLGSLAIVRAFWAAESLKGSSMEGPRAIGVC